MKLLYLINSSVEQLIKHKFVHIVLIIAVMISAAVLNYVSSVTAMAVYDTKIIESFKDSEVFFISAETYRLDSEIYHGAQPLILEKYKEVQQKENISVGMIRDEQCKVNDGTYADEVYNILVHSDIIKDNLSFSLKSGKQLYEYTGDAIPIILTDNHPLLKEYKIGDQISMMVAFSDSFDAILQQQPSHKESFIFEICGIMKKPYRYYREPMQYSVTASNVLNRDVEPMIFSTDWITSTEEYATNRWNKVFSSSKWIADITVQKGSNEYDEAYKYLSQTFETVSYENFLTISRNNFKQGIADAVYILTCVIGLIAVAIGSANIYIGKKQIRSFAINFISGAKWSDCIVIDLIRNLSVIIIPSVISSSISGIFFSSQTPVYYNSGRLIEPLNLLFVILLMTVLFLISSLPYIIKLKKTEPITFVRTMNRE